MYLLLPSSELLYPDVLLFAANSTITLLHTALHLHHRNDGCALVALMFLFFHATFVGSVSRKNSFVCT